MPTDKLLELEGLTKYFYKPMGLLGRRKQVVQSVDHVSLHILRHETFGLVGESGCGKSTLGRTITIFGHGRHGWDRRSPVCPPDRSAPG